MDEDGFRRCVDRRLMDIAGHMDFEWKEVDWDRLLAEQDKAEAPSGKR